MAQLIPVTWNCPGNNLSVCSPFTRIRSTLPSLSPNGKKNDLQNCAPKSESHVVGCSDGSPRASQFRSRSGQVRPTRSRSASEQCPSSPRFSCNFGTDGWKRDQTRKARDHGRHPAGGRSRNHLDDAVPWEDGLLSRAAPG